MMVPFPESLDPIPESLTRYTRFQYGSGEHSNKSRKILGSIILTATSNRGIKLNIRHIIIEGFSQWVIGENVTGKATIDHLDNNVIIFKNNNQLDSISLVEHEFLSYIHISRFCKSYLGPTISCLNGQALSHKPWPQIK